MNVQLGDPNMKVDLTSAQKILLFYIEWISNIENVFKKFKTGFDESGLSNLPSILDRIANEWKEFGKDADKIR